MGQYFRMNALSLVDYFQDNFFSVFFTSFQRKVYT